MGTIKVASGASGNLGDDTAFAETLLKDGGRIQALSYHYYAMPAARGPKGPATGFGEDKWAQELSLAVKMEDLVRGQIAVMDKIDPQKRIALYVDEWGSWYDQEPGSHPGFLYQQNTIRDAEVAALTLNIFQRHTDRIKLAAIAQMVNVLQAMILTDKEKMVLTPTYHLFDMYVPFQGATPYPATATGPNYVLGDISQPSVDVSAARGTDGKLWLSLVNVDPHKPARVTTNLAGKAKGRVLTGATIDAHNRFEKPDAIKPVTYSGKMVGGKLVFDLPAKSIAVVAVE
jgi:alpha-N-arabinofuranosidase